MALCKLLQTVSTSVFCQVYVEIIHSHLSIDVLDLLYFCVWGYNLLPLQTNIVLSTKDYAVFCSPFYSVIEIPLTYPVIFDTGRLEVAERIRAQSW